MPDPKWTHRDGHIYENGKYRGGCHGHANRIVALLNLAESIPEGGSLVRICDLTPGHDVWSRGVWWPWAGCTPQPDPAPTVKKPKKHYCGTCNERVEVQDVRGSDLWVHVAPNRDYHIPVDVYRRKSVKP